MFTKKFRFGGRSSDKIEVGNAREYITIQYCENDNYYLIERDLVGVIPGYICRTQDNCWVFSTRFESLKKYASGLNKSFLKKIKNFDFTDQMATAFHNIWRIPPGSKIKITMSSIEVLMSTEIFDLELFDNSCSEKVWIDLGHKLIRQAVQHRQKNTSLFCSSGYDSNLLSEIMPTDSKRLLLNFQNEPERDLQALEFIRESPANIECHLAESFHPIEFQYSELLDPSVIAYSPNLWIFKPLLKRSRELGCRSAMTGLGGDDLFQPSSRYISQFNPIEAIQQIQRHRMFDQADHSFIFEYWNSYLWPLLSGSWSPLESLNSRLFASGGYQFALEQEQELAQHYDQFMTYPLLDIDLIRYVLSTPASLLGGPYSSKNLLRRIGAEYFEPRVNSRVSQQDYSIWRRQVLNSQRSSSARPQLKNFSSFDEWIISHYTFLCEQLIEENLRYEKRKETLPETHFKENWEPSRPQPNY